MRLASLGLDAFMEKFLTFADKVIISIEYILSARSTNHSLLDGGDYNLVHFK